MSEAEAPGDTLSVPEINLLWLLDDVGTKLYKMDGSIQWALGPDDLCVLLELAIDLIAEWGPTGAQVYERAASLLRCFAGGGERPILWGLG